MFYVINKFQSGIYLNEKGQGKKWKKSYEICTFIGAKSDC
jgi:hypothetical protein